MSKNITPRKQSTGFINRNTQPFTFGFLSYLANRGVVYVAHHNENGAEFARFIVR